jgi:arylsulfatase A-like enzyme
MPSHPTPTLAAAGAVRQRLRRLQLPTSHACILTVLILKSTRCATMVSFVLDRVCSTLATLLQQAGFSTAAFVGAAVLHHQYGRPRPHDDDRKLTEDCCRESWRRFGQVTSEPGLAAGPAEKESGSARQSLPTVDAYYDHFPYDPLSRPLRLCEGQVFRRNCLHCEQVGSCSGPSGSRIERTLIVLMADGRIGRHGEFLHGVFLYDATTHIPLLVWPRYPGWPRRGATGALHRPHANHSWLHWALRWSRSGATCWQRPGKPILLPCRI